jgi:hypothetical protein
MSRANVLVHASRGARVDDELLAALERERAGAHRARLAALADVVEQYSEFNRRRQSGSYRVDRSMADSDGKPIHSSPLPHPSAPRAPADEPLPPPCVACGHRHGSVGVLIHCLENEIRRLRAMP